MRSKTKLVVLSLLGCSALDEEAAELSVCAPGETITMVFSDIRYARQTDGVAWGFDLDDHRSTSDDPEGCRREDLVDPDGNTGVDNAFSGLIPILESTEAAAVEELIGDSINNGNLLLMVEVSGVQNPQNDDCVNVGIYRGEGSPLIGTDDMLLDGQSFRRDLSLPHSTVSNARIVDGVLEARPLDIVLPFQILNEYITVEMETGGVHLTFMDDGSITGFLGGAVPVANLTDIATLPDVNIPESLVSLLASVADVYPDENGICDQFSMALEVEAIPAHFVPEHAP